MKKKKRQKQLNKQINGIFNGIVAGIKAKRRQGVPVIPFRMGLLEYIEKQPLKFFEPKRPTLKDLEELNKSLRKKLLSESRDPYWWAEGNDHPYPKSGGVYGIKDVLDEGLRLVNKIREAKTKPKITVTSATLGPKPKGIAVSMSEMEKINKIHSYKDGVLSSATVNDLRVKIAKRRMLAKSLDKFKSTDKEYEIRIELIDMINEEIKLLLGL